MRFEITLKFAFVWVLLVSILAIWVGILIEVNFNIYGDNNFEQYKADAYIEDWNEGVSRCDSIWYSRQAEMLKEWENGYTAGFLDAVMSIYPPDSVESRYHQLIFDFTAKRDSIIKFNEILRREQ